MDDAALVRRARGGDRSAWGDIYDRYADQLHDYCWSILRDRHEAEDALHDAFVTAAARLDQLRRPERLRPWLYAICRTTALAAARRRTRQVPTEDLAVMTSPAADPAPAEVEELQRLVWAAAGGLAERDRAVLDLHLRHGLTGEELGDALGVSAHHAAVLVHRTRETVERSLGALLVGRTGRRDCAELDALLEGWDGTLTPLLRKRVARHIDRCDICGERRRAMVSPLQLLGGMPLVAAPIALRSRTVAAMEEAAATGIAPGRVPGRGHGRWARSTSAGDSSGARRPTVAAVVTLLVAAGLIVAAVSADDGDGGGLLASLAPGTSAAPSPSAAAPATSVPGTSPASAPPSSGAPAPASPAPDAPPATTGRPLAPPTTATSAPTDPPATTATPTTTVAPIAIGGVGTERPRISFDPACNTTGVWATVSGPVTDVVLSWESLSGTRTATMVADAGGTYRATIGPVLTPSETSITWWIDARDANGTGPRTDDRTLPVGPSC